MGRMANRQSIVFAPELDERQLDRETEQVNDKLASVGEDVPVTFDAENMDSLSPAGAGGGGRGGGLGAGTAGGGVASLASRIPKPISGVAASAVMPVALAGGVGATMASAMMGASARLQTSASLLSQAWNSVWRPIGDRVDELFIRDLAKGIFDATSNFEDHLRNAFEADGFRRSGAERLRAFEDLTSVLPDRWGGIFSGAFGGTADLLDPDTRVLPKFDWPSAGTLTPDWNWPDVGSLVPEWRWPDVDSLTPEWRWPSVGDLAPDWQWPNVGRLIPNWQWPSAGSLTPNWNWPTVGDLAPNWSWPSASSLAPDWNWPSASSLLPDWAGGGGGGGGGGGNDNEANVGEQVFVPGTSEQNDDPTLQDYANDLRGAIPGLNTGGRITSTGIAEVDRGELVTDESRLVQELSDAIGGGGGGGDMKRVERKLDSLNRNVKALQSALDIEVTVDNETIARAAQKGQRDRINDTDPMA